MAHDVVVLVGSLRRESLTRKVAAELIRLAPPSLACEIEEIGMLPHYNQDLETDQPPRPWVAFRERVRRAHAVLFATPEYNRSVPGVLKNAIDVGSRPREQNAYLGKPAAIVSVSPGALGGVAANLHLRQMLVFLDMPALQRPEAYIGMAKSLFDERGNLVKDDTREYLRGFMKTFADWIERLARGAARR